MNEGDSAGGGHQGPISVPPAVPDRRSNLSTINPISNTSSSCTNNISNQTTSTVITIAPTHETPSTSTSTITTADSKSASASSVRSFQQVFTQEQQLQLQKQEQQRQRNLVSSISGSKTKTSSTIAYNNLQEHMQKSSTTHNVAGVATTALCNLPQKQQRVFVAHVQTSSSYSSITSTNSITSNTSTSIDTAATTVERDTSPLAKRLKIDAGSAEKVVLAVDGVGSVVGSLLPTILPTKEKNNTATIASKQDINCLKKLIIEQKSLRLKSLKEKHFDHVAEQFYLQSGGNMMDYSAWRKKPPSSQFLNFCNTYRLDRAVNEEKPAVPVLPPTNTTIPPQQQTAENIAAIIGIHSVHQQQPQTTQPSLSTAENYLKTGILPSSCTQVATSGSLTRKRSLSATSSSISDFTSVPISSAWTATNSNANTTDSGLPQGAEIKIPAVGATPVAVSTQLPAAVVQLTQKGGTPLVPCESSSGPSCLRRNGNGIAETVATALTSSNASCDNGTAVASTIASAGGTIITTTVSNSNHSRTESFASNSNSVQEFSFKAKQEVYVMQRISELQREGLWTEKRLPKLQEPSRPKAHWDYLLEEMVWLAADFAQERKWKKNAAKKCAKMVQKYFQEKANAVQKAEKAQELHLKRIASFISKEVKMFWSNVEKLVEYKHQTKLEEKRKKALDQHLSFIVDQTEKFSQQLTEGMNKSVTDVTASAAPSINSSQISSPKRRDPNVSDDEFRPASTSEDDEETIAKAEEDAADVNEEVTALEKESQMDLNDFLKDLPEGYLENRDKILIAEKMQIKFEESDDEFEADESSDDDENTISQEEAEGKDKDFKRELDELEADNDLTVEELIEKYRSKPEAASTESAMEKYQSDNDENTFDSVDDFIDGDADSEEIINDDTGHGSNNESDTQTEYRNDELKKLLQDNDVNNKDDMIKDAAALAESIQPKGNTLSSTNVVTPIPFLLKHSLREYQHIGLDWLVTMHDRKLNGILADEMGLGKTIQTIALLAHLAYVKCNWGPHLIVVPSSVMLNWEMEFKKWCPGFKILTYYGTQKERKMKRVGWTKPNAFHVCITSYKLVVQDQQSFRRKKWKYLILDEAQNIKNFKSQRWQLLLNFSTERRLLLTGTPLQNDLMELWSLMHFLMPYVFSSHREFKEWFSNPMTGMIEGNMEYNESLISRLHKVIRPFLLRRLKKEVEKQMPKKYEHVVTCRLSNRQRYLYDDFMSRTKTKETLQTGNLLNVINVLMQLRKVCNHPNMFEPRPIISPFQMERISYYMPRLFYDITTYDPFVNVNLHSLNLILIELERTLTAYVSYKSRLLAPPRKLIEEIDTRPTSPPRCPPGKCKFHIRIRNPKIQTELSAHSSFSVRVGASPAMKTVGDKLVPIFNKNETGDRMKRRLNSCINDFRIQKKSTGITNSKTTTAANVTVATTIPTSATAIGGGGGGGIIHTKSQSGQSIIIGTKNATGSSELNPLTCLTPVSSTNTTTAKIAKIVQSGKPYFFLTSAASGSRDSGGGGGGGRLTLVCKSAAPSGIARAPTIPTKLEKLTCEGAKKNATPLLTALAEKVKTTAQMNDDEEEENIESETEKESGDDDDNSVLNPSFNMRNILEKRKERRLSYLRLMYSINKRRTEAVPIYGSDCRNAFKNCTEANRRVEFSNWRTRGYTNCKTAMGRTDNWTLSKLLKSYEERCDELNGIFSNFVIYVPSVCAPMMRFYVNNLASVSLQRKSTIDEVITKEMSSKLLLLHPIISAMTTQFPDPRLIQYDCGKLQTLDRLLRRLKTEQHRVLIFTQMTKMLDILEAFLNYHGHIYLRLDGSTRVEQRQALMERFNADKRIFCFILSTRSGGVGINLTGADTVIFYDSDWNPTMDAQAQDRCHRIGQTRDVHIYRLVSDKTIEVNILKKANQKRMLSDMAIEGGNFTASYFKSTTIKDLFNIEQPERELETAAVCYNKAERASSNVCEKIVEVEREKHCLRVFETALAAAEDEQDVQAAKIAKDEVAADLAEFDETIPLEDSVADFTIHNREMSKADLEVQNLVKQLTPIERYAMRFVEETGAAWTAEQLRAAEAELEAQKREWEANRLAALQKEEEMLKQDMAADDILTYSRKDANNQVITSKQQTQYKFPRSELTLKKVKGNKRKSSCNTPSIGTRKRRRPRLPVELKLTSRQNLRSNKNNLQPIKMNCHRNRNSSRSRSNSSSTTSGFNANKRAKDNKELLNNSGGGGNGSHVISTPANRKLRITIKRPPMRKATRGSMTVSMVSDENDCDEDSRQVKIEHVKLSRRNHTGVKNQKLLSVSKKKRRNLHKPGKKNSEGLAKGRKLKSTADKKVKTLRQVTIDGTKMKLTRLLRSSPKKKPHNKICIYNEDNDENEDDDNVDNDDDDENEEEEGDGDDDDDDDDDNVGGNQRSCYLAEADDSCSSENEKVWNERKDSKNQKKRSRRQCKLRKKSESIDLLSKPHNISDDNCLIESADNDNNDVDDNDDREDDAEDDENNDVDEDDDDDENEIEIENENDNDNDNDNENVDEEEDENEDDEEDNSKDDAGADEDEDENEIEREEVSEEENNNNDDDIDDKEEEVEYDDDDDDADDADDVDADDDVDDTDALNTNSMDIWSAHTQIHDTTMTNSTYYNVSEESDSEENSTMMHLSPSSKKIGLGTTLPSMITTTIAPTTTPSVSFVNCESSQISATATPIQNQFDVNSPRTRSRGSVKINLWTLDISPVLPGVKPHLPKASKKDMRKVNSLKGTKKLNLSNKRQNVGTLNTSKAIMTSATDAIARDSSSENNARSKARSRGMNRTLPLRRRKASAPLSSSASSSSKMNNCKMNSTLHRWLGRTPKVIIKQMDDAVASSQSEQSETESASLKPFVMINGAS